MTPAADEIQSLILRWYHNADLKAGGQAFSLLKREWLLPVARFIHRDVMSADTEDALSSALLEVLSHSPDRPPRALAPPEHLNPKAWRSRVLRNTLISAWRRQRARRAVNEVLREEHLRRPAQDSASQAGAPGAAPPLSDPDGAYEAEQRVQLQQMRRAVVRVLPTVPVRRRCAIGLLLGVDLSAWVDELAAELGDEVDSLHARLTAASTAAAARACAPMDPKARCGVALGDELADEQIRILYPTEELNRAREALRKTIERGVKDVQAHLAKEGA